MRSNPRINCLIGDSLNGVSFYRALRPLSQLDGIFVENEKNINWGTLSLSDMVFMSMPYTEEITHIINLAKKTKTPVWADFDDDPFNIPEWNPVKKAYNSQTLKTVKKIASSVDVITVTTQALYDLFKEYNDNIIIIPNAFDDLMFDLEPCPSSNKIINWRGSMTHLQDLRTVLPKIKEIQEEKNFMDWTWNFIGRDATVVKKEIPAAKVWDFIGLIQYFNHIRELNPILQIVPLVDHTFNHSKSNIAWLEGIYSGAVTVAPSCFEEFNRPGVVRYKDTDDFKKVITELMANPEAIKQIYMEGYNYIKEHLLLSNVNKMRIDLLKKF
jgi:glycosyltransferase involved in cell wall biosynthesis